MTVTPREMAHAVRFLAMDAITRAGDGHPGTPLGAADICTALFNRHLKFDPAQPQWPDRDRFVQSNGHGSTLIFSLLHLAGYAAFPIEQIRAFRELGSHTPGHPEYEPAHGVEITTGPLGQGHRQRRGHGGRGGDAQRRVRRRHRRSLHLCAGRRRLPDGRHRSRDRLARRPPEAGQADRPLRLQPDDRRRGHQPGDLARTICSASPAPAGTSRNATVTTRTRSSRRSCSRRRMPARR